ncbi:MAG: cupin domain-containing protein [Scytolyngbya sp. HA4215-MV1]|nr:cupin domain-containing protein [Scytolyngbya sp. HA4215-MV1]
MSLTKTIAISDLECIHATQGVDICSVDVDVPNVTEFRIPSSHETNLVYIAPGSVEELFVHHFQTDQLLVVKGSIVLVVLQDGTYQYILMSDRHPQVVKIPPGIPHGAININAEPCVAINSVIRHGPPHERDYRPLKRRLPYDLTIVQAIVEEFQQSTKVDIKPTRI